MATKTAPETNANLAEDPTASDGASPNDGLSERLAELDSLLSREPNNAQGQAGGRIPVVDEVVTAADFDTDIPLLEETVASRNQLQDVTERLEQKISRELDQLARILKDNLKKRIARAVKAELDSRPPPNNAK